MSSITRKKVRVFEKRKQDYVIATMRYLHESIYHEQFEREWPRVRQLWLENDLETFVTYFEKTWLTGLTTKWQNLSTSD